MAPFPSIPFFTTAKSKTTSNSVTASLLLSFKQPQRVQAEFNCQWRRSMSGLHSPSQRPWRRSLKHFKTRSPAHDIEFRVEVKILCQLHHPNIVPLVGFCEHKNDKFVVYDYVSNGSMAPTIMVLFPCHGYKDSTSASGWLVDCTTFTLKPRYLSCTLLWNRATFFWTIIWCLKWHILDFARSTPKRSQGQSHQELSWRRTWRLVWNTWSRSILWLDGYQTNLMCTLLGGDVRDFV